MLMMQETHSSAKDLNLLEPLRVLLEERHVTKAARRIHLSQSAMSRILEKLRQMFGDELLIRSGKKYERTSRGERLLRELDRVLPQLDDLIRGCTFQPEHARHRFRLSMTDYAAVVILPKLVRHLSEVAPHITLEAIVRDDRILQDLESGRIDLSLEAAGAINGTESSLLFPEEFVCLVAEGHPYHRKRFGLEDYLRSRHIMISTLAGQQTLVDRPLANLGLHREVAVTVPYFVAAALCLKETNYIATVPKRLLNGVAIPQGLRLVQAPIQIPAFHYVMLWHRRLDQETSHRWLRDQIATLSAP